VITIGLHRQSQGPRTAFARSAGLLAALIGLVLLAGAPSLAAAQPAAAAANGRVGFAMRGPLHTGRGERLVFHVEAPAGARPTHVLIHLTMAAMPMHEPTLRARPLGGGRYAVHADLSMPGAWVAHVTLARGATSVTRSLPFRTIDGGSTLWRRIALVAGALALLVALGTYRMRRRPEAISGRESNA
jgi:hypothetical protein